MRTSRFLIALFLGINVTSICFAQAPTWTRICSPGSPPARYAHAMAYDSAHSQVVLFGGVAIGGATQYGDTWVWDGTTWAQRFPSTSPSARSSMAMAYDAAHGQVVRVIGPAPQ